MKMKTLLLTACLLVSFGCDSVPDNITGPGVGVVTVNVTTSGSHHDPDGYVLTVTGEPDEPVSINDTRTFSVLTRNVRVELMDVAENCAVSDNPVDVDVDTTTTVAFFVECV